MTEPTHEPEKTQVEGLWETFKASGDADTRERLILHYSSMSPAVWELVFPAQ